MKKLCVIVLTRIYRLTHGYQTLVREITTPSLSGFIAACLKIARLPDSASGLGKGKSEKALLLPVLQALSEIIVLHPTSFRPFLTQIQNLVSLLIAPTVSTLNSEDKVTFVPEPISEEARHLFVLLHVCAAKNGAGDEWSRQFHAVLLSAQNTSNKIFRALIEDWRPSFQRHEVQPSSLEDEEVSDQKPEPLELPGWINIYAGIERLDGLLRTLQVFLASATSVAVTLPVSSLMALIDRILSIFSPMENTGPRTKPEIGRNEREGLFAGIPRLHVSAMEVLSLLILRLSSNVASLLHNILEQVLWVLEKESSNENVRRMAYEVLSQVLIATGRSLPRSCAPSLSRCIKSCCQDLLPSLGKAEQTEETRDPRTKNDGGSSVIDADSYLKPPEARKKTSKIATPLVVSAQKFLPLIVKNLPQELISFDLRNQIDRVAILTKNRETMLACVANPKFKRKGDDMDSSILPLLARAYPNSSEVESFLRPQMPIMQSKENNKDEVEFEENDDTFTKEKPFTNIDEEIRYGPSDTQGNQETESTFEPGNRDTQSVDQMGGTKELAIGTDKPEINDVSAAELSEPKFVVSYPSNKRDRDERYAKEGADDAVIDDTRQIGIKRTRLDADKIGQIEQDRGNTLDQSTGYNDRATSALGAPKATNEIRFDTPIAQSVVEPEPGDSDESDFEMPTLHLDPDSDQESDYGQEGEVEEY